MLLPGVTMSNVIKVCSSILSMSMRCWKVAGAPKNLKGSLLNWNKPYGVEKDDFS